MLCIKTENWGKVCDDDFEAISANVPTKICVVKPTAPCFTEAILLLCLLRIFFTKNIVYLLPVCFGWILGPVMWEIFLSI